MQPKQIEQFTDYYKAVCLVDRQNDVQGNMSKYEQMRIAIELMRFDQGEREIEGLNAHSKRLADATAAKEKQAGGAGEEDRDKGVLVQQGLMLARMIASYCKMPPGAKDIDFLAQSIAPLAEKMLMKAGEKF